MGVVALVGCAITIVTNVMRGDIMRCPIVGSQVVRGQTMGCDVVRGDVMRREELVVSCPKRFHPVELGVEQIWTVLSVVLLLQEL